MGEEPTGSMDYRLYPDLLESGIKLWLEPVLRELTEISGEYLSAHAEVADAHGTEAAGWFGGQGNGEVRSASSSFLNEVTWQLQQLSDDQTELVASLQDYKAMLLAHITQARETEDKVAQRFHAIDRQLSERGK